MEGESQGIGQGQIGQEKYEQLDAVEQAVNID